jgi:putative inorganic carbon (hco3(-)) transporter
MANRSNILTPDNTYGKVFLYGGSLLFITANGLLMLMGFYYLPVLPLVLAVVLLAIFSPEKLFMAVVFVTPLSLELSRLSPGLSFDLSLPTEPVIMLMVLLLILKMIMTGGGTDTRIIRHPVSIAILFYLIWLFITTLTSSMPLVSVKFFIVRFWFIAVFYFMAIIIFRKSGHIRKFLWSYILALLIVIIYTLYRHSGFGFFSQAAAHWVVRPFYNDHTAYGAALAMFIPVLAVLGLRRKSSFLVRTFTWALLAVFMTALVFSYSRAAWLSLAAASLVWIVIWLRIGIRSIVVFSLISLSFIFMLRHDIVREMEKNRQDSSADLYEHIRSMTNITSDASNLERINRWKAAIGMFREKPVFGWGPGTYMFRYAPFQNSYDRTIISTNFADGGDAHSEYLGPLSESGLLGLLSILVLIVTVLYTGFRLCRKLRRRRDRLLATGILIGLITYLVHGVLNNFLHTDKLAVPFWGFTAILVAMDLCFPIAYSNSKPRIVISSKIPSFPSRIQ